MSLAFKIFGCPPFLQIICVLSFSDSIFCSHLFFHCISMTSSSQPPMTALHFNALQGSVLGHLSLFCILHLINSTYSYKLNGLPSICWGLSKFISISEFPIDYQTHFQYIPKISSWRKQFTFILQTMYLLPPPIPGAVSTILALFSKQKYKWPSNSSQKTESHLTLFYPLYLHSQTCILKILPSNSSGIYFSP